MFFPSQCPSPSVKQQISPRRKIMKNNWKWKSFLASEQKTCMKIIALFFFLKEGGETRFVESNALSKSALRQARLFRDQFRTSKVDLFMNYKSTKPHLIRNTAVV